MKPAVVAASVALALVSARPALGQVADPKAAFFQSVARFGVALDGPASDDGRDVRAALDAMSRGLEQWDASLRSSESIFAANLPGSPPAAAARMHIAIGAAFLDRSRLQDALREFLAGSRLDPARADVFTFQGVSYDQILRDFDRAAASYRQAAALDPLSPVRAYLLARALAKGGRRADALEAYRTVLRLWRRDVAEHAPIPIDTPFVQLGLVQERAGAEPFFPPVQYADGFVQLQRGDYAQAVETLKRAFEAPGSPRDERTYLATADALVRQRKFLDAEAAFQDVIKAFPASGRAHYRLGRLYHRQNRTLEALAEYEAAAKLTPLVGANRLLQTIGALHAAQQSFDAALQAYATRVDIILNDPAAHRSLGYLYARLDRPDEAFAEFAIALVIAPGAPDVHVAMSQLHLKGGDFPAAADAARRALALNASSKQAHYTLGTALMRLEKPDEARPEFEAFERLQAEDTAAAARQMTINGLRREAAAHVESREYDRALAALRKALELAPNAFELHEQLASVYDALGQRESRERELTAADELRMDAAAREADR
jgi:tetratricopeptide (TPR) repeat protein